MKTIQQCKSCPWRTSCAPERDIPHGYTVELHENLRGTCRSGIETLLPVLSGCAPLRTMACHYSKPGEEIPCAGWLHNQLGPGNNIGVRLMIATGRYPVPEVDGEQHETFEDTLPRADRDSLSDRSPARRRKSKKARTR